MALLPLRRNDSALRLPVSVFTVLLVIVLLGEFFMEPMFIAALQGATSLPPWLPQFQMTGKTVGFYMFLLKILEFIAIPAVLIWVAYAYGRHNVTDSGN